ALTLLDDIQADAIGLDDPLVWFAHRPRPSPSASDMPLAPHATSHKGRALATHSLDHLVGSGEQHRRHGQVEDARGLAIDDHLDLPGRHNRLSGGVGPFGDAGGEATELAICTRKARPVADHPADLGELTNRI